MTELSFLIELLLEHELKADTKKAIAARIKDVESDISQNMIHKQPSVSPVIQYPKGQTNNVGTQAPSTLALMAKHGDIEPAPVMPPIPEPMPVTQVAHTPAAAAAMNSRNAAISASIAGKVDKTTGRPKKW